MKLYHVTSEKNAAEIKLQGLIPAYSIGLGIKRLKTKWRKNVIWLTDDPNYIIKYQAGDNWMKIKRGLILTIECTGLIIEPYWLHAWEDWTISPHEFIFKGKIEAERIL